MKPPRYVLISPVLMLSIMALALVAGLAGCGGNGNDNSTASASGLKAVSIKNYLYSPAELTVERGTTVKFTNGDSTNHTATAAVASALDTGTIAPGKSKTVAFETPGTYRYFCSFHPFMKGTITVTG